MAQTSAPFDAGAGAAVNEATWQKMSRSWLATGVVAVPLGSLAVTAAGAALSVSVGPGQAQVEGFFYENDSALALTIATANATNPRIDTIVVRLDRTANTATLAVVTGTAAASPVAPTLSATDALFEMPLANVTVPAAAGVIVAGNVADRRAFSRNANESAVATAVVPTGQSTTSLAYVDLTTVGPAVSILVGPSGRVRVDLGTNLLNTAAGGSAFMGFAVSGATTVAASSSQAVYLQSAIANQEAGLGRSFLISGLTPGVNTFTAKYANTGAGSATFSNRQITATPA